MAPLTPEQQKQVEAMFATSFARNAALDKKRRLETGELEIELGSAPDDPPPNDPGFQQELATFGGALRAAGIAYSQRAIAFDSVEAHGYHLAEFAIQHLGPPAIGIITAAVTGWFAGRAGRKARLKFGDVEAEARTSEEVEQLLKSAAAFRAQVAKEGKEE